MLSILGMHNMYQHLNYPLYDGKILIIVYQPIVDTLI